MDEVNIKINIPEGYEIDKEKSTFESIVLKPIKVDYDFISKKLFYNKDTYYVTESGSVKSSLITASFIDSTNCTSRKQAEKLLAINQLMNVSKYLNGDWKPSWEKNNEKKYVITLDKNDKAIWIERHYCVNVGMAYFKTEELAKQAIKILGEETIKLALSTDW